MGSLKREGQSLGTKRVRDVEHPTTPFRDCGQCEAPGSRDGWEETPELGRRETGDEETAEAQNELNEGHDPDEGEDDPTAGALHISTFPKGYDARRFELKDRSGLHIYADRGQLVGTFYDGDGEHFVIPSARDGLKLYRRPRRDKHRMHDAHQIRDTSAEIRRRQAEHQQRVQAYQKQLDEFHAPETGQPVRDTAPAPQRVRSVADFQKAADELWKRET